MTQSKRAALKARIESAQARDAARSAKSLMHTVEDKALEAKDRFTHFAKEHPVATVAGGVVLGLVVASFFKGPRRVAARTGAKAASIAALGSEIARNYASAMMADAQEAGREGKRKIGDLGDTVGDKARQTRRDVGYHTANLGDAARIAGREAGKTLARAFQRK